MLEAKFGNVPVVLGGDIFLVIFRVLSFSIRKIKFLSLEN